MTRFFYTDALEAAYMGKHFGMRFRVAGSEIVRDPDDLHFRFPDGSGVLGKGGQYVGNEWGIHPDSLQLLEVRVNDMVLDSDGINGIAVMLELQLEQCRGAVIIERKGRPFFWPQSA